MDGIFNCLDEKVMVEQKMALPEGRRINVYNGNEGGVGYGAKKKEKSNFYHHANVVIPIAILGVVMTFYSQNSVREGMVFEIEKSCRY